MNFFSFSFRLIQFWVTLWKRNWMKLKNQIWIKSLAWVFDGMIGAYRWDTCVTQCVLYILNNLDIFNSMDNINILFKCSLSFLFSDEIDKLHLKCWYILNSMNMDNILIILLQPCPNIQNISKQLYFLNFLFVLNLIKYISLLNTITYRRINSIEM